MKKMIKIFKCHLIIILCDLLLFPMSPLWQLSADTYDVNDESDDPDESLDEVDEETVLFELWLELTSESVGEFTIK